jgi:hypothetical protein
MLGLKLRNAIPQGLFTGGHDIGLSSTAYDVVS